MYTLNTGGGGTLPIDDDDDGNNEFSFHMTPLLHLLKMQIFVFLRF